MPPGRRNENCELLRNSGSRADVPRNQRKMRFRANAHGYEWTRTSARSSSCRPSPPGVRGTPSLPVKRCSRQPPNDRGLARPQAARRMPQCVQNESSGEMKSVSREAEPLKRLVAAGCGSNCHIDRSRMVVDREIVRCVCNSLTPYTR